MGDVSYEIIGVMSGTSLDGIDLAHVTFSKTSNWSFTIHSAETIAYSKEWKERLKNGIHLDEKELKILDKDYTAFLAGIISSFIKKHQIENLDAVCTHGHTILHQPEKGITLQIGNLPEIATLINERVVCDFRKQDVEFGGQGAPLVPVGDELLFKGYDYCLNLGGFANVSTQKNGSRIAYDICPANLVLNYLAEKLGHPYDNQGKIASNGNLLPDILGKLNELPFYQNPPPKSLGLEWVIKNIFPLLESEKYSVEDMLHTFTEHVAIQLAANFTTASSVLVTGGGAYNLYLLERLKYHKQLKLVVPHKELVEYKEALIFGLLGVLKLREEINCLASVTGAGRNHSSGVVYG